MVPWSPRERVSFLDSAATRSYGSFLDENFYAPSEMRFEHVTWREMLEEGHIDAHGAYAHLTEPIAWNELYSHDPRARAFKEDLESALARDRKPATGRSHVGRSAFAAAGSAARNMLLGLGALAALGVGMYLDRHDDEQVMRTFKSTHHITYSQPDELEIERGGFLSAAVKDYLERYDDHVSAEELDTGIERFAEENGFMPPEAFNEAHPEHAFPDGAYLEPVIEDGRNINPHLVEAGTYDARSLDDMVADEIVRSEPTRTVAVESNGSVLATILSRGLYVLGGALAGAAAVFGLGSIKEEREESSEQGASSVYVSERHGPWRLRPAWVREPSEARTYHRHPKVRPRAGAAGQSTRRPYLRAARAPASLEHRVAHSDHEGLAATLDSGSAPLGNIAADYVASTLYERNNGRADPAEGSNERLYGAAKQAVLRKAHILNSIELGLDTSHYGSDVADVVESLTGERVSKRTARGYLRELASKGHETAQAYLSSDADPHGPETSETTQEPPEEAKASA